MKLDTIKINGFGKIKNKEIKLKDGINIIYGENESGKSTILKFIESMLYGLSKNKNGKNKSDFDRYQPWALRIMGCANQEVLAVKIQGYHFLQVLQLLHVNMADIQ